MKKIVAMGAAVALAASMFAAEPAANASVVSFTGNASVEWGVDLDSKKTGFDNGTWTEIKTKLFDAGNKSTSGSGDVWAELVIKGDDEDSCGFYGWQDGSWKGGKNAEIDVAKFHFGDFYIGIKSGDTQVGELDLNTALRSTGFWANNGRWLAAVGTNYTKGIVAGYANGNLEVNVDFRSDAHYTNNYAMAAEVALKDSNEFVNGLAVKAGFAYGFETEYYAYSASTAYKVAIDDKYYVKPAVGMTGTKASAGAKATDTMKVAGTVLFGWGDTNGYGSVGLPYFTDDSSRGMTPGVSVSFAKSLIKDSGITIIPAFYLGDLVENMKAAAYAEIGIPSSGDTAMAIGAGVGYDVKADDLTITPKFACRYVNKYYTAQLAPKADTNAKNNMFYVGAAIPTGEYFDVTASVDVAGLINNTTFTLEYVSGNLKAEPEAKKGTVNVRAKISF